MNLAHADRNPRQVFDLIWTLVRTDFKTRYYGTVGGFAWALLKPLANFTVLVFIFSFLFKDPDYGINLLAGLILYDFFGSATKAGLTSLAVKGYLIAKAKMPTWVIVVCSTSNSLITLLTMVLILVGFMGVLRKPVGFSQMLLIVLYIALLQMIVVGMSLAASVWFLRFRDLDQVWEVMTQAGFFIAPIIYPLGIIPERFHFALYLWPPTPVMQFTRMVLVGGQVPSMKAHLLLVSEAVACLVVGWLVFQSQADRSAEHL